MTILESTPITEIAWYTVVLALLSDILLLFSVITFAHNHSTIGCILLVIGIIFLITVFILPKISTGKMSYTIEITDPRQYQILIEKGYSFTRLFENKEIYTIIGDVL